MTGTRERGGDTELFKKQLQFGLDSGGGMGAMMAFMGLPWNQKQGGSWTTFNPRNGSSYPMGTNPMGSYNNKPPVDPNAPTTGGDLPPVGTNKPAPLPGDQFKLNLIPEWWKEWYRTQGQNGAMPPVDGLL